MGLIVWVTRALPGAQATAEKLIAMGHHPVIAPLIALRRLTPEVDLTGVAALAFTSANAVEAFSQLSAARDLPVYAVGDATAEAAGRAGFAKVSSAAGDVAGLAALIAGDPPGGLILSPGAKERAGDLIGALQASGIPARALTVYETAPTDPDADFDPAMVDIALVHSSKAGRALAAFLADQPAPDLVVCCLSLAAAAPLAATPLAGLDAASQPTEAALLALI